MRVAGSCRVVDILGEWGNHEGDGRLQLPPASLQGDARLLAGVEVALTYRSPLAWRVLAGWPMACARITIHPEDVPALRIADGRTAEEWTTAILSDQTDSGAHVRSLADAGRQVVGPLTCTAQAADDSGTQVQSPIVIFDGWHRVAAWIALTSAGCELHYLGEFGGNSASRPPFGSLVVWLGSVGAYGSNKPFQPSRPSPTLGSRG